MANYNAIPSKTFGREFDKLSQTDQGRVLERVSMLEEDPFYPSLRSKKLRGKTGYFECSVNMDIRIIWDYGDDNTILLIDVGHHDVLKKY